MDWLGRSCRRSDDERLADCGWRLAAGGRMSVIVELPQPLRALAGGKSRVEAEGSSVAALLDDLDRRYPGLKSRVADETGRIRRHINLFINGVSARRQGAETAPLAAGDTVIILPAVSGG